MCIRDRITGTGAAVGTALVEIYEDDLPADSELANISTLGFVGTGNDVLIAGFIVGGPGAAKVVLRALGPSLAQFGVSDAIQDPTLQLRDANGSVTSNDDWGATVDAVPLLFQPTDPRESVIQVTLTPGSYTAIVQGKNATSGVALVEAYDLE